VKKKLSFKEKVWAATKLIPPGKVSTYKEVSRIINQPQAFRAVGQALNKNKNLYPPKFSGKILADEKIPCHRVIRSSGFIGGYVKGQREKIRILKKEGVQIKNQRVDLKRFCFIFGSKNIRRFGKLR